MKLLIKIKNIKLDDIVDRLVNIDNKKKIYKKLGFIEIEYKPNKNTHDDIEGFIKTIDFKIDGFYYIKYIYVFDTVFSTTYKYTNERGLSLLVKNEERVLKEIYDIFVNEETLANENIDKTIESIDYLLGDNDKDLYLFTKIDIENKITLNENEVYYNIDIPEIYNLSKEKKDLLEYILLDLLYKRYGIEFKKRFDGIFVLQNTNILRFLLSNLDNDIYIIEKIIRYILSLIIDNDYSLSLLNYYDNNDEKSRQGEEDIDNFFIDILEYIKNEFNRKNYFSMTYVIDFEEHFELEEIHRIITCAMTERLEATNPELELTYNVFLDIINEKVIVIYNHDSEIIPLLNPDIIKLAKGVDARYYNLADIEYDVNRSIARLFRCPNTYERDLYFVFAGISYQYGDYNKRIMGDAIEYSKKVLKLFEEN